MKIIELFLKIIELKELKRTGWVRKEIPRPESVADHSFGVALLALLLPIPKDMNHEVLIKMALLHDLGESVIGDIVCEEDNLLKKEQKHKDETKAIESLLENNTALKEIALDYIQQRTPEALYLKELDKLDMVFQAFFYEKNRNSPCLQEFWDSAQKHLKNPAILELFQELNQRR